MRNFNERSQKSDWLSADGWESADSWESADAWGDEGGMYADAGGQRSMPTSSPYIIQLVNACTTAIANVDVGDSYLQRAASNFGQSANITITSTVSGTSYIEFLAQTESQPFKIGRTVITSATAGQFDQTVAVTHRDAGGNRSDHIITPFIDPYQTQTDRIIDDYEYLFDGYTRLRFNQINASATVTLRLFPVAKFVATQIVAGRPGEKIYRAPHLIKVAQQPVGRPKMLGK